MKKLFSLLMLFSLGLGLLSSCDLVDGGSDGDGDSVDVGLDECRVTNNIRNLYEGDAIRLAVRLQQASGINDIQIPPALIDRTLGALSAVYNSEFVARDSVTTVYDIHTLPAPAFNRLTLEVSTDTTAYPWIAEWQNGNRLTGNATIDQLMNIYGLDRTDFISLSLGNIAIIESTSPLNLAGLAAAFEAVDGVIAADFENESGDGNDISVTDNGNYLELAYSIGFDSPFAINECASDCTFRRTWTFHVFDDCSAAYISVDGDPAP